MTVKFLKKKIVEANVYELGLERTRRAYERFDHVAVSFSGGKDSTICLHLALEVAKERDRLPLDVFFFDEEAIHPETVEYMRRVSRREDVRLRWFCIPVQHRNACSRSSPYWYPWAPEDREKWCRELPPEAITELVGFHRQPIPEINGLVFPKSIGSVGVIVGLRTAESLRRYRAVASRVTENFISPDPCAKHVQLVKPIYDWSTDDVWTAPKLFGWDHNRTYDVFQKAGMTRHQQRVCPPYGEEPLGGLYKYAICWPELWEKMLARVPGASTASRYARSPLYGFSDLPSWDPSDDPKKLIQRALNAWPEHTRAEIIQRINLEIRNHHRKCKEPIPAEQPGETGVTWKYLYMLAVRGDFKGRRTPVFRRQALMQPHVIDRQPIASVQWVDPATLRANNYNPNKVFGPEMRLLKLSILAHGWTQPIVARADGEIIDGFHRWTLASKDEDICALTGGLCPVVKIADITSEEQMIATIRHNRARGQHGVIRMGDIVRALIDSGMDGTMIESLLQMESEEVQRLADITPSPQQAGMDHFGKGWVPTR